VNGRDPAALDRAIQHLEARIVVRAEGNRQSWSVRDISATRTVLRELRLLRELQWQAVNGRSQRRGRGLRQP